MLLERCKNVENVFSGDFNCYIKSNTDSKELKSMFSLYSLKQHVTTPTRIAEQRKSVIDLVFTNVPFNITTTKVFPKDFSDHELVGFIRKACQIKTAPKH